MRINSSSGDKELRRGGSVTLYCSALCAFHQLEVDWFKDGHALPESGPTLQLNPLTVEDSGNYTCGLKISGSTLSLPYSLQVEAEEERLSGQFLDENILQTQFKPAVIGSFGYLFAAEQFVNI